MTFGLRRQLLLIGILTLSLPIASVFYIRETEAALRSAQGQFLADLARSTAPLISTDETALLVDEETLQNAPFALPLNRTPLLDGYREDWGLDANARPAFETPLSLWLGDDNGTLWLQTTIDTPAGSTTRVELACVARNGNFSVTPFTPGDRGQFNLGSGDKPPIRVSWQPDSERGQLEMRIPADDCAQRLGLSVTSGDRSIASYSGSLPGPVRRVDASLTASLARNRPAGVDAFVLARDGWRVTSIVGDRAPLNTQATRTSFVAGVYRRLIGGGDSDLAALSDAWRMQPQWTRPDTVGQTSTQRLRNTTQGNNTVAVAATPLTGNLKNLTLVLRQNTSAILTLANPSLVRLTNLILLVTLMVVGLLLAYATWLSARVRKLARAAGTAVSHRGDIRTALPGSGAVDEIGDVTRGFETLLGRVREQQQWLKSLADTLSHELRTPIAVVQSSLDNLMHSPLSDDQKTLAIRASDGVARLRATLNAMSTANRAEQAARDAQLSNINLSQLLTQLTDAYTTTFADHQFGSTIAPGVVVSGSAELIVQLLDKLIENAAQFAPRQSRINIQLEIQDQFVLLSVTNSGPPLPEGDAARLFDSFVSHRENDGDTQHLGFGLYIARLIAEAHRGSIAASDTTTQDGTGVRVRVTLPVAGASE